MPPKKKPPPYPPFQVIEDPQFNNEAYITSKMGSDLDPDFGQCDNACASCGALHWKLERNKKDRNKDVASYPTCCSKGSAKLGIDYGKDYPDFLKQLLTGDTPEAEEFQYNIRSYNNALSFASLGAKVDKSTQGQQGVFTFRVGGELFHNIRSLVPFRKQDAGFAQIYVVGDDDETEAKDRIRKSNPTLNSNTMLSLQQFLSTQNSFAQFYRTVAEVLDRTAAKFALKHIQINSVNLKTYNRPSVKEIAMVIANDKEDRIDPRDIELHQKDGTVKRITDEYSGYLALRYPIFFPYGQPGWARGIPASAKRKFFRTHQTQIKTDMYSGVTESIREDTEVKGKQIILPSTYIGSPRSMCQLYQDSMAIVGHYGRPSLFITITANPAWFQIGRELAPGQTPSDRPDIGVQMFKLVLDQFCEDVIVKGRLGKVAVYVHTIEFQKRGLPHCHMMLMMEPGSIPNTAEKIDALICAEIPDPVAEPVLHNAVSNLNMHGPCSKVVGCLEDGQCTKHFPKPFQAETSVVEDSYPLYRRRDDGQFIIKRGAKLSNQYVVPYNKYLTLKYNCHINVEVPYGISATKYLFKYIMKGSDRSSLGLSNGDEIKQYINGRYVGPCEENEQAIYYVKDEDAKAQVASGKAGQTTLTEFFRLNKEDIYGMTRPARDLYYHEVPTQFYWTRNKVWEPREKASEAVGRLYYASIKEGERFYLRVLLQHTKGPTSFVDLKTVDGRIYPNFRSAAEARNLLWSDAHYQSALREASLWMSGF
ncbi:hypothetical protein PCANC_22774 [Puccinia coronata f. sp. avenae]|uniref:Helitron helicase-like domain-containing protein n=1 Tax=Puccinia coronata f. sp. avenae TaxID=200324 RepID=A0A2N5U3W1_9BASI|nr:hypothetical protein PCANC_22774 [Puccinia coronata f. sp. avenae]